MSTKKVLGRGGNNAGGLADPKKRAVTEVNFGNFASFRVKSMGSGEKKTVGNAIIDEKTEVNATCLALIIGTTARRVQQLAQDGIFKPVGRGKYNLAECVQAYIEYKSKDTIAEEAILEKLEAEAKLKKAKALIADLEAKELQGKMHRSEDVAAMTEDLIYAIRSALLALPGRLAMDVSSAESAAEAADIIRKEVYLVMEELSNYKYDPAKYEERVRERRDWETDILQDDADDGYR